MNKVVCSLFLLTIILLCNPLDSKASVIYEVRQGDSLWKIAKVYDIPLQTVIELNQLDKEETLVPGQVLLIPGQRYIVRQNESLYEIASNHSLSITQLMKHNQLDSSLIMPAQTLQIPKRYKRPIMTGAFFVPSYQTDKAERIIEQYENQLSNIAFFEFHPDASGNLSKLPGTENIPYAWKKRMYPYATVTNLTAKGFDPSLAHRVMTNPAARNNLVNQIFWQLKAHDLEGIVIDFEGLDPKDRKAYNLFIKALASKLHPSGMKVALAVPPLQGDYYPGYHAAYDYKTLGKHADYIFLMTYDWHWAGGPSGPIAPINKVEQTVKYATQSIPKHKIILGIPMYAYDWTLTGPNKKATAYSQQKALEKARYYQSEIHYDSETAQPYFRYTDNNGFVHEVWFEDARSFLAKAELLREYQLAGIGGWKLGLQFNSASNLLLEEFIIRKP
ncbi:glycosyl hydrolase family 18 protein [Bacillus tianshenii]|nr:glycosyl hydrolase family 18 protein [Bacillus tianshenii]